MEFGEILLALTTDKLYFTEYLGVVFLRGEAAVNILDITGGDGYIFGYFIEIVIVTTVWAGQAVRRGREVVWLHRAWYLSGFLMFFFIQLGWRLVADWILNHYYHLFQTDAIPGRQLLSLR